MRLKKTKVGMAGKHTWYCVRLSIMYGPAVTQLRYCGVSNHCSTSFAPQISIVIPVTGRRICAACGLWA